MLSPHAQDRLGNKADQFLGEVDQAATKYVVSLWKVPPHDVACSGVNLAYTRNEADVQIELRYTVGADIYKPGEVFDPSIAMESELIESIMQDVAPIFAEYQMICSVWCKPHVNSKFVIPGSSD
jgi:hypothetical protein